MGLLNNKEKSTAHRNAKCPAIGMPGINGSLCLNQEGSVNNISRNAATSGRGVAYRSLFCYGSKP
ncbi:MAG TPA: hypothetical protein VFW07_15385 [Parafilimonas sp.]|nr:hypothetical protein [Parafilimonas sp.]